MHKTEHFQVFKEIRNANKPKSIYFIRASLTRIKLSAENTGPNAAAAFQRLF